MFKWFKKKHKGLCVAVIAAGGSGSRMGGDGKQLILINEIPMIARSLLAFEAAKNVDAVVVVAKEDEMVQISRIIVDYNIKKVVQTVRGGQSRIESVAAGIAAAPKGYKLVAIHDGARPLVSSKLIDEVVEAADLSGAAAAAIKPVDTVRKCVRGVIGDDFDRERVVLMQTPQVFLMEEYDVAIAYAMTKDASYTDDVAVYRMLKKEVTLVEGERTNIKITIPQDILIAEMFLEELL